MNGDKMKKMGSLILSLFVLFIAVTVFFSNRETKTSTTIQDPVSVEVTSKIKLIKPNSPEWLFTNGPWKEVDEPTVGKVMKGWLVSGDVPHYGRRVKIETDSSFAVLKQVGIGGTLTVFVDGKPAVEKKLTADGKVSKIPLYENKTGWHKIEIVHSSLSELDGLFIDKKANVRKPVESKKRLVVMGHSYAEGYGSKNTALLSFAGLLEDKLGVESINQAVSKTDLDVSVPASSKNSGLDRLQSDVIDLKPDYVLLVYGYNASSRNLEQYQKDYSQFLTAIQKALPETKVFASGIPSVSHYSEEDLTPKNLAIQNACHRVSNCTFIDMKDKWNETNYSKYIGSDGVHPSDEGHAFLAEEYAKAIRAAAPELK
ncbi:SGNH/GDSL hydrolase family protein [Fictibacillus barbaricus]|uniref:Lysophospholipase L1-like esterase n=1 Tax=Fictibacillus barbaricus TaxID=182136 RepID=A0ABU1TWQ8_9BACL|nr:SGNH/GDSL hydrolase family protein [Fictibacillus barbaricus]MDR7071648.1 lysophospholipase L1-like esterase [Fictibacillus barbaricus]